MTYKPSASALPDGEPWSSMQRLADQSRASLAAADIIGHSEDEARSRLEQAGLAVRAVQPGGVITADWCATRVTVTLIDGRVREARIG